MYVFPIFEREGSIWQERLEMPPTKVNALFRSVKRQVPISTRQEGDVKGKLGEKRYEEREDGLGWMCEQNWQGIGMGVEMRFYERTLSQWTAILDETYPQRDLKKAWEVIGKNTWMAYVATLD